MSSDQKPVNMGLQLFPPPPKKAKPARKTKNSLSPQDQTGSVGERSVSPSFGTVTDGDGRQSALDGRSSASGERQTSQLGRDSPLTVPGPAYHGPEIPRSHTSFSEAPTLVRSNSNSSHSSSPAARHSPPRTEEPVMRSIFPRYRPEIPLEHQPYFPTQASPGHIPREIINRAPYSPTRSYQERTPLQSPGCMSIGSSPGRFPHGLSDEPPLSPATNDEMKELWKCVNGWRVSASEGRSFCLKMSSDPEEPTHTLSCASQPFYTLRLIPTSTSAQMTLYRHDPNKAPFTSTPSRLSSPRSPTNSVEVLATTLEEKARMLPPNDGLVALLYPRAASNMVMDLSSKPSPRSDLPQVIAAAERECGRLVWDHDSSKYYLVHPALQVPFTVTITSSPAWSRVEYTLEHPEIPKNIVRLVRDGAGGGTLEVDTGVAAKIDAFYVVDVAICAVLLVAIKDEETRKVERFEGPPTFIPASPKSPGSGRSIRTLSRIGTWKAKGKDTGRSKERDIKIEEFEMDLESQDSVKAGKVEKVNKEEKIPGFCGLIWMLIKCFVWMVALVFKGLAKCIVGISKYLSRSKS